MFVLPLSDSVVDRNLNFVKQDRTGRRHQSKREKTAGGGLGPPESSCLTGSQEQECQSSASECLVASDGRLSVM